MGCRPILPPTREFIARTALEHHRDLLELYGIKQGTRQARKHLGWYLDRLPGFIDPQIRRRVLTSEDPQEVVTEFIAAAGQRHSGLPHASMSEAA